MLIAIALAVVAAIAALGTAASLRYGVRGRRLTASLVVVCGLALTVPAANAPKIVGLDAQAITCLRALNAAQLVYQTSYGKGRYALSLEDLATKSPTELRCWTAPLNPRVHRIELFSSGDNYAAIAVPQDQPRQRATSFRSFCVDAKSSIFQTPGGAIPKVDADGCRDRTRPLQ